MGGRSLIKTFRPIFRFIWNFTENTFRRANIPALGRAVLVLPDFLRKFSLTRRLIDAAQPNDPIGATGAELPQIELVLAVAEKDFRSARSAIDSSLMYSRNHVAKTTVVVPSSSIQSAKGLFSDCAVVDEDQFIPSEIRDEIEKFQPEARRGWIKQQVVGLYYAYQAKAPGVLVQDSDTIFIKPLAFLDSSKKQLLQFSHEYFPEYERHAQAIWGNRTTHKGMSYVTHYQLMQPEIVREMFPDISALAQWVGKATHGINSPLADYHSYGRFLSENNPNRVALGRWGNKSLRWSDFNRLTGSRMIQDLYSRDYFSISTHTYLES